jgi:hypothetical protein
MTRKAITIFIFDQLNKFGLHIDFSKILSRGQSAFYVVAVEDQIPHVFKYYVQKK